VAEVEGVPSDQLPHLVPLVGSEGLDAAEPLLRQVRMAEFVDWSKALELVAQAKVVNSGLICALRLPLQAYAADRILAASKAGVKVFHLCADLHGHARIATARQGEQLRTTYYCPTCQAPLPLA
jgi:hypothetical protein